MLALGPTLLQKKDGKCRTEIDVRNTGGQPWSLTQRDLQSSPCSPHQASSSPVSNMYQLILDLIVRRQRRIKSKHMSTTIVVLLNQVHTHGLTGDCVVSTTHRLSEQTMVKIRIGMGMADSYCLLLTYIVYSRLSGSTPGTPPFGPFPPYRPRCR